MTPRRLIVLALVLGMALPLRTGAQGAGGPSSSADDAEAARLQRLQAQWQAQPRNRNFLYDYLQALEAAGRDRELIALRPHVDPANAPATVLGRFGRAYSNQKMFAHAVEVFRLAVDKAPGRVDLRAGYAYALIDSGRAPEAIAMLESRMEQMNNSVPLLEAYAEALRAWQEPAQSLLVYERILAIDPGNREAMRNRIFTVARLGAPHRALELAAQSPGVLTPEELARLEGDRAAIDARHGAAADPDAPDRFARTDEALEENARQLGGATGDAQRRLQFDRVALLRNRYRMQEAVVLYEQLAAESGDMPGYVQAAAADAYLYLEQPEKARDLYAAAIAQGNAEPGAKFGLFYAYNDAEQYREALAQIDRIVDETPSRVRAWSPQTVTPNPDYASAVATQGAARAYQDRFQEAQARLEALRDSAPWNMEGRERLAGVYASRGWPRRAQQEYEWILAAEPRNRAARIGHADLQRELREWRAAESEALALEAEYPEDRQVQQVARRWTIHKMRELRIEAGTGEGSGGPFGSREHRIEGWLYSAPVREDWRAYLHQFDAQASFPDGKGLWQRIGAGAEYRVRDLRASAEVHTGYGGAAEGIGLTLAGDWWLDDHWNFEGEIETLTNDVPLQGRTSGMDGRSLRVGAMHRVSESRRYTVGLQVMDFSDGNRRNILSASAFQRLVTGPVFKLDATLGLSTSRNSLQGANYFNPESDFGAEVTLVGEQRIWRRYHRSFVHRAHVMAGTYRQEHFGSGSVGGIRYEHEWALDERLTVLYGVQRSFHPYDGVREYVTWYNLMLNWRF